MYYDLVVGPSNLSISPYRVEQQQLFRFSSGPSKGKFASRCFLSTCFSTYNLGPSLLPCLSFIPEDSNLNSLTLNLSIKVHIQKPSLCCLAASIFGLHHYDNRFEKSH